MQVPYYEVDAFTNRVFAGNPAGVCISDRWLPDELMQAVAAENNFSETAFVLREGDHCRLTWFTPTMEVDLCGHATLAAAHVLLRDFEPDRDRIVFHTKTDELIVEKRDDLLAMDFPSRMPEPSPLPGALIEGLGAQPREVHRSRDLMAVFDSEEDVRRLAPDFTKLLELDCLCIIATAPGKKADFISRVFAPAAGVDEDPVTGSAHCSLIPFWAKRLGKPKLHALQVSARGGELFCEDRGDRCTIAGAAVIYLRGTISVPDAL
jgi:PhzF family phenazine biosynthesis protein